MNSVFVAFILVVSYEDGLDLRGNTRSNSLLWAGLTECSSSFEFGQAITFLLSEHLVMLNFSCCF